MTVVTSTTMDRPVFPDLRGASVFITGGGSGIGAALTIGFLEQGAKVAFVGRRDASDFVAHATATTGHEPLFIQCDITDIAALRNAVAKAAESHGDITVLVNNAANDTRHLIEDVTEEFWDANQAVNLKAYFFAAQAVAPGMQRAGHGAIVNFSSISYMLGQDGYISYLTANSGINGMTRALARELGPHGIRANTLAPGWVLTERQLELWATDEDLKAHMRRMCLKEHLKPQDIVSPTLFLCSRAAAGMTGQSMVVDGGVVVTG